MSIRHTHLSPTDSEPEERAKQRGLGPWIHRNSWLLIRLFIVLVFTFGASTTAANFSYGLKGAPVILNANQINQGQLPPNVQLGDYVEIRGTPDFGPNPERPQIGVSTRYEAYYYYFKLKDTGDNLLIQTAQTPPNVKNTGEQIWRGKLATVGTVIFHDTTQEALKTAQLPQKGSIPVIETGDTPEYYRQVFPAYAAIIGLWAVTLAWLLWRRNKPFKGL